jgi:hypothetical protein
MVKLYLEEGKIKENKKGRSYLDVSMLSFIKLYLGAAIVFYLIYLAIFTLLGI